MPAPVGHWASRWRTMAKSARSNSAGTDGKRIVTASGDHAARIWDAVSGRELMPPLQHDDWVISAQFSSDGQAVLTFSADATARVWDARTGKPLVDPLRHRARVNCAQFS